MSGHSKFANIKHKKEKNDAAKGKIFTIIGREIAVAVKEGGPDPANNSKLRDVIAKAKAANMPNDNIMRSVKKAAGDGGAVNQSNTRFEKDDNLRLGMAVKQAFANRCRGCICPPEFPVCVCGHKPEGRLIRRKPATASPEETAQNPRSRSAKLRSIEKL